MKTKLYYQYDKGADILYFSQGKPSPRDASQEISDDIVLRLDPKSKRVKGFTILNFASRSRKKTVAISLPIQAELTPGRTALDTLAI
ncbi:DUF2283 domain-containing protein [Candidatus Wolfebacteria bacterium]|nr:DUF2283 domain-containing protein [Candidatus Wolfebacteria bacterium]